MPIHAISENPSFKILGKIRLGVTKKSNSGSEYPTDVEHFVLKDVPEVEAVYGKDPSELHIIFPTDDIDTFAPTWLKLYKGGSVRKDGSRKGGDLLCKGTGPHADGSPGKAIHYERRDLVTRVIPERECLGAKCPDWGRGCKETMSIIAFLPLVSMAGLYQIDTSSKVSIRDFHNMFTTIKAFRHGGIARYPFKIFRAATEIPYTDPKTGKRAQSTHHVMRIAPCENFMQDHGNQLIDVMRRLEANPIQIALPAGVADTSELSMEDHYPALEAKIGAVATAQSLVQDPEIRNLFAEVGNLMGGSTFTDKAMLVWIRQREGTGDLRESVVSELKAKVSELLAHLPEADAAAAPALEEPVKTRKAAAAVNKNPTVIETVALDSEGII